MWTYWWYCDPNGPDPWRAWYDSQNGAVKGRHDLVFKFLEDRLNWAEPHAKKLDDGLVEIILKTKVEHRLFGFCWPARLNFTILIPCTHGGKVYHPSGVFETAASRMIQLKNGRKWIRRCVRPE